MSGKIQNIPSTKITCYKLPVGRLGREASLWRLAFRFVSHSILELISPTHTHIHTHACTHARGDQFAGTTWLKFFQRKLFGRSFHASTRYFNPWMTSEPSTIVRYSFRNERTAILLKLVQIVSRGNMTHTSDHKTLPPSTSTLFPPVTFHYPRPFT